MTDYVTLPGTAKDVDSTEITLADGTTLVYRQRMSLGDGKELSHLASVDWAGRLSALVQSDELATLLKAVILRLDLLNAMIGRHYTPPDNLSSY